MLNFVFILFAAQTVVPAPGPAGPALRDRAEAYYHFSLGLQARFQGDTQTSLEEYRKAQKLDARSSAIRVETARLLRDAGKLDEALAEAKEAVRLGKDDPDAHLILAQLYQMQAEGTGAEDVVRKAAAELEEVVRLQPADGNTMLGLAGIYAQLQQPKDAARVWQKYLTLDPGSLEGYIQLGTQLLAAGESEQAATAFRKAVELQPSSARAYQSLGEAYARAQQADQAILNYRKALEIEPGNLRVRLALGETLFRSRRHKEVVAEADAVLAKDPRNRFAFELKGRALRELKEFDQANAAADEVLAQDPTNLTASYLKVTIAEARRDFASAAAQIEAILSRNRTGEDPAEGASNDRVFLIHLGFAYQQQNRYADAAGSFARAMAVGGEPDAQLLGYHAEALYLAKDLDRALAAVRSARSRFPDDPDLASLEATVLRERGDLAGALAIVEKLRQKSPRDVKVLTEVAEFYRRARNYPEAEAVLRGAREIEAKNLSVLFQLGAALERQQRHDEAEAVFREALAVEADSAPILNYLGYMNADRNVRVEEALGLIEKALALDPENSAYLDSRGWALYRLGRLERAEQDVRQSLGRQAKNAVVLGHLGDILARRGKTAEAMASWQKALQGEDDEGELDRARVERKIRDAQTGLQAESQKP